MTVFDDILAKRGVEWQQAPDYAVRTPLSDIWARRDAEATAKEIALPAEKTMLDKRKPRGVVGHVFDYLSRGEYFSASLANSLLDDEKETIGGALATALGEVVAPQERRTFTDVIEEQAPEFAKERPILTAVLGLAAGIALDPINYVPFAQMNTIKKIAKWSGEAVVLNGTRRGRELVEQVWTRALERGGAESWLSEGELIAKAKNEAMAVHDEMLGLHHKSPSMSVPVPDSFIQAIADVVRPASLSGIPEQAKLLERVSDHPAWIRRVDEVHAGLKRNLAAFPGALRWGAIPIHGGYFSNADMVKGLKEGGLLKDVLPNATVRDLSQETIERFPLQGEMPVVALVPEHLRRGGTFDPSTKLSDLAFFVGDEKMVRSKDVKGALDNVVRSFAGASDEIRAAKSSLEQAVLRSQRSAILQSTYDELGLGPKALLDQGGLHVLGKTILSSDRLKAMFSATGANHAVAWVSDLPTTKQIAKVWKDLRKKFSVKDEAMAALGALGLAGVDLDVAFGKLIHGRSSIEARMLQHVEEAQKIAVEMGTMLEDSHSEKRVMDVLLQAQDDTRKALDKQWSANPIPGRVPKISAEREVAILNRAMDAGQLNVQERSFISVLVRKRQEFLELQGEAGLFKVNLLNYTPVRWRMKGKLGMADYIATRKAVVDPHLRHIDGLDVRAFGGEAYLPKGENRLFALSEHARAEGWEPVYDITSTVGQEFLQRAQGRVIKEHNEMLRALVPKDVLRKMDAGSESAKKAFDKLTELTFRTLRHEPALPDGTNAARLAVKILDSTNAIFKKATTIWTPSFILKNLVGDLGAVAVKGPKALLKRNFDPTALSAAIAWVVTKKAPKAIEDALGHTHSSSDLIQMASELPIFKNLAVDGVGTARSVERSMRVARQEVYAARAAGAWGDGRLPSAKGMAALAARTLPYTDIPGKLTDIMRGATFMNYLSHGHDYRQAFSLMEESLFDYTQGLTKFEERVMARVIPFYRFTKFSTALTLNLMRTKPGNLENLHKVARTIGDVWAKIEETVFQDNRDTKPLTTAERGAMGEWLFEQPHAFAGIDPVLKEAVFRTFNGLSFLDWMSMLQLDDLGEVDFERTATAGGLAQIAPFIKMPLEWLAGQEFFTEAAIGPGKRSLGPVDEEEFFFTLTNLVGGAATGSAVGIAGASASAMLLRRLGAPELMKQILGWEKAVDPRDGVEKAYVNPYTLQVASTLFPPLRTAIATSREDRHPAENVLRWILGTSTVKLDLLEEANYRLKDHKDLHEQNMSNLRKALIQGRDGLESVDDLRATAQESLQLLQDEARLLTSAPLRGDGR